MRILNNLILLFIALALFINPSFATVTKQDAHTKKSHHKHIVHKKHKNHHHKTKKKTHGISKKHTKKIHEDAPAVSTNDIQEPLNDKTAELSNLNQATPPALGLVASIEQRLVNFVQKSVSNLHYSHYKLGGTKIDSSHGIYIVDCSGYVDHTLRAVFPNAYLSLVNSSGTEKPNSSHYYNFFKGLSDETDEYWSKVNDIEQLQPGDILVFRNKSSRKYAGGHVMVVMNKPVQDGDTYLVSVADSAASGHSEDTRTGSGVGIGTLLLKVNPKTGQPSAYAWKIGSRWKNNVNFAMARPTEIES
ncbi:MAG: hypothetical protein ACYCQI_10120 [Gammaproteobacteria bacterium]